MRSALNVTVFLGHDEERDTDLLLGAFPTPASITEKFKHVLNHESLRRKYHVSDENILVFV